MAPPIYKICLLGDGAVGKTALRERYLGKPFTDDYKMTIGCDIVVKAIDDPEIGQVNFQIWDLSGQPSFDGVRMAYYSGAAGGVIVFDITRAETFNNTARWTNHLWRYNGKSKIPLIILGNKIDLRDSFPDSVQPRQGQLLAEELTKISSKANFQVQYLETSALTRYNVDEAFSLLGKSITRFRKARSEKKSYSSDEGKKPSPEISPEDYFKSRNHG
ncbi:MAG: GTP-binding protein [Candidatus Hodarchaeales archaeon]|jgi:small GTP-binding protein